MIYPTDETQTIDIRSTTPTYYSGEVYTYATKLTFTRAPFARGIYMFTSSDPKNLQMEATFLNGTTMPPKTDWKKVADPESKKEGYAIHYRSAHEITITT